MKKCILLLLLFVSFTTASQILEPVQWEFGSKKISETEYELVFVAKIDMHWSIYSQFVEEGGPLPTLFSFEPSANFELVDTVKESKLNKVTQFDNVFEMVVSKFYEQAVFTQRVKINAAAFNINGNIDFMSCDDSKCTYKPDNPFTFKYTADSGFSIVGGTSIYEFEVTENANDVLYGMLPEALRKAGTNCSNPTASLSKDIKSDNNSLWQIFGLGISCII